MCAVDARVMTARGEVRLKLRWALRDCLKHAYALSFLRPSIDDTCCATRFSGISAQYSFHRDVKNSKAASRNTLDTTTRDASMRSGPIKRQRRPCSQTFPKSLQASDFPLPGTFFLEEIIVFFGCASQFEPLTDPPDQHANSGTFFPPVFDGSDLPLQPHTQSFLQLLSFQATSTLN